ncbi:hypothetical protein IGL98_000250 [Enterococcus sp. DIV0840]|uniref:hypothetical protein n=1 Tax=unclassified Enterococcus TaxID=2608891 RepID=UPI001A904F2C|nr:hypothetical protein [Enterococcus sp. DIV0849a]MBO0435743.1 hypothetical protein [Enterococcus sp. DIV0849a]
MKKARDNRTELVVIKKNFITIFVPLLLLLPMLFTFPFLTIAAIQIAPFFAIIPILICLMLIVLGVQTLNMLIRFGNKKLVVYEEGLEFCMWNVKFLKWKEVLDIKLSKTLNQEFLVLNLQNDKKIETNIMDSQLNKSNDEIYSIILESWYQAMVE